MIGGNLTKKVNVTCAGLLLSLDLNQMQVVLFHATFQDTCTDVTICIHVFSGGAADCGTHAATSSRAGEDQDSQTAAAFRTWTRPLRSWPRPHSICSTPI